MKNTIPKAFDSLLSKADSAAKGLHEFSAVLDIVYNTEEHVLADTAALIKSDLEYQTAKSARIAQTLAFNAETAKALAFITVARDNLKPQLGSRYSRVWDKAGFRNGSLALPNNAEAYLGHVKTLESLYEAEPALETPETATKAIATVVAENLSAATDASKAAWVLQRQKRAVRDTALAGLRVRLQNLFGELKQVLSKKDPRWRSFGFNVPGDVSVPAAPEAFAVSPGLPGHLSTSWEKPVGATRFRIFCEVVGVDEKPAPVNSTTETSIDLGGLTSGAHLKLYVIAANEAGESLPSNTVEIVVP